MEPKTTPPQVVQPPTTIVDVTPSQASTKVPEQAMPSTKSDVPVPSSLTRAVAGNTPTATPTNLPARPVPAAQKPVLAVTLALTIFVALVAIAYYAYVKSK
ncbi:MAG TPA: hypothetical protein VLE99_00300 [Candidatus Saccharimonadales bacterium]|nr:hypothetical protein [Candidatus Saccharimonadales bacterium]